MFILISKVSKISQMVRVCWAFAACMVCTPLVCMSVCAGACECDQLSVMNVSVLLKAGSITAGAS